MNNILLVVLLIAGVELLMIFLFVLLAKLNKNKTPEQNNINALSILKGVLERGFVTFALMQNFPQVFTVFAALKIATRIKDDTHISNDFYLIGNIISITLAIIYYKVINIYLA